MTNLVATVHKLGRQLQYLAGYLDLSPDETVQRRTDFSRCQRPVLLLYGFLATRRTFEVLERRLRREYRRKVRTISRGIQTLFFKRALLLSERQSCTGALRNPGRLPAPLPR